MDLTAERGRGRGLPARFGRSADAAGRARAGRRQGVPTAEHCPPSLLGGIRASAIPAELREATMQQGDAVWSRAGLAA